MDPKPVSGHCLCGEVTYTADTYTGAGVCHCEACRRGSGAPYSLVIHVPRQSLKINGPYKEFAKQADSGQLARHIFCPNCGSRIVNNPDSMPDLSFVKAGTLDSEIQKALQPEYEVYAGQRLSYIQDRYGKQFEAGIQ